MHGEGLLFERESRAPQTASAANPAGSSQRHDLSAGGIPIGVLVSSGAVANGQIALTKEEHWHRDHLGSVVATTDHAGVVTARFAYDPFGKRRQLDGRYDTYNAVSSDGSAAVRGGLDRGFTGHEHLDELGLVHMNGRLYDPRLGRFLQADPVLQDPLNLQNYDRYGYCFGDPLNCVDPSGYCFMGCFWHGSNLAKVVRNPYFRVAAAIAIGVVSYGSSSTWATQWLASTTTASTTGFSAATIAGVSGAAGGLAAGFATGMYLSGGDLEASVNAGVRGAVIGGGVGALSEISGGARDWDAGGVDGTGGNATVGVPAQAGVVATPTMEAGVVLSPAEGQNAALTTIAGGGKSTQYGYVLMGPGWLCATCGPTDPGAGMTIVGYRSGMSPMGHVMAEMALIPLEQLRDVAMGAVSLPYRLIKVVRAAKGIGALEGASGAAFRAAERVGEFSVPLKHLPDAAGRWAKFAEGVNPNALIKEALSSSSAKFLPNSVEGSYKVVTDMGRVVGTNGETSLRVIFGQDGKIWTAFPVK